MSPEHPENDLTSDADYFNLRRPEPRDFDELADQPDPAEVAASNRASSRQAIIYLIVTIILSYAVAMILAVIFRFQGGEFCDGDSAWLCTPTQRQIWGYSVIVVPLASMLGCAVIMVRKLKKYLRWRTWMGIFWFLVPHFMIWAFTGLQTVLLTGQ